MTDDERNDTAFSLMAAELYRCMVDGEEFDPERIGMKFYPIEGRQVLLFEWERDNYADYLRRKRQL